MTPPLRTLLVDDNARFLAIAAEILAQDSRIEIVGRVSSGCEGVEQAANLHPDVVFMDLSMPDLNGLEATRIIKAQQHAPCVVIVTLHEAAEYRAAAEAVGADHFLNKAEFATQWQPFLDARLAGDLPSGNSPYNRNTQEKVSPDSLTPRCSDSLPDTEVHYQSLFERAPVGLFRTTVTGQILEVNPALVRMLGYPNRLALLTINIVKLYDHPEARAQWWQVLMRGGDAVRNVEAQVRCDNGSMLWVTTTAWAVYDTDGQLLGYEGVMEDISARRQAVEQAQESERRYQLLVEHSLGLICMHDLDGTLRYVNPVAACILGYEKGEEVGRNLREVLAPEVRSRFGVYLARMRANRTDSGIMIVMTKAGERRYWAYRNVRYDEAGKPSYVIGHAQDITTHRHVREELKQEVQLSNALAHVGKELISTRLDTATILKRVCQLTAEALGCDCGHIILCRSQADSATPVAGYGDTPEQWAALQDSPLSRQAFLDMLACLQYEEVMQVSTAEAQNLLLVDFLRQAEVTRALFVGLYRGQTMLGVLIVGLRGGTQAFTPQQERLALRMAQLASLALTNATLFEELGRANGFKLDFLSMMSHELRTPLSVITGYTRLLLEDCFGSLTLAQRDPLQRVDKKAWELYDLIATLLEVGHLEARQLSVKETETDIAVVLEEIKAELPELDTQQEVEFVWQLATELPVVHTDRPKLKVVLKKLIDNALKFTQQGCISVCVQPYNQGVEVCVADTGVGIEASLLPLIFEMFQQGDSTSKRPFGGTGLGLYIVRQLIELLHGTIHVESQAGQGSTFRVWVPTRTDWMTQAVDPVRTEDEFPENTRAT